jgi:SAM-dependent methyltransferase
MMDVIGRETEYWDRISKEWAQKRHSNDLIAEHKRKTHLRLIARWTDLSKSHRILKTDLFEEANGPDEFLFDLAGANNEIIGIDVSNEMVKRAKQQGKCHGIGSGEYFCCDVRLLPLRDNSIDLIISNSTLDHFPSEEDIVVALKELGRVLRVGGTLLLTLDNKSNLTYPPYIFMSLWMRLGLAPYFIGRTLSLASLRGVLRENGFSVEESTAIMHYPHPDGLVRLLESFLHKLGRGKLDNAVRTGLDISDKLETKRTRYWTGRYIAVKGVKRQAP